MVQNQASLKESSLSTQNRRTVTLLLPTYNEVDGLRAVYPHLDVSLFDDVLMVDGGSTDGTLDFAREHGIRVVRQRRPGLAFAVFDAIRENIHTDCVVEFSPDGNCMPDQMPDLVARLRQGDDLVVVSRYLPPAKSYDDSALTAFGNWMFTRMFRMLGPFPITDSLTIYRGFDRKIVGYPEFEPFLQGPVFEPLVSALANLHGLKTSEIPGDEPERIGGVTKRSIVYNGSCILLMWLRCVALKLFGVVW